MTAKARRWKRLEEREQAIFESFMAGWMSKESYDRLWREVDRGFRALGNVPIQEFA
jgi:hypothetical protein